MSIVRSILRSLIAADVDLVIDLAPEQARRAIAALLQAGIFRGPMRATASSRSPAPRHLPSG